MSTQEFHENVFGMRFVILICWVRLEPSRIDSFVLNKRSASRAEALIENQFFSPVIRMVLGEDGSSIWQLPYRQRSFPYPDPSGPGASGVPKSQPGGR